MKRRTIKSLAAEEKEGESERKGRAHGNGSKLKVFRYKKEQAQFQVLRNKMTLRSFTHKKYFTDPASSNIGRRIPQKSRESVYQGIFVLVTQTLPSSHWAKQCMNATILTLKKKKSANSLVHVCTRHNIYIFFPSPWHHHLHGEDVHLFHTAFLQSSQSCAFLLFFFNTFFIFFCYILQSDSHIWKSLSWKFTSVLYS